ncbi:MAG: SAM-dependent methyltransferase [Synechococcales cyanobacterium RU_4_20]|nr:SAM-dependent methyltransferase [Synechococcales cyanobacterium RU_4_20]
MSVSLDEIVPFGRSLAEYRLMFNLTDTDLEQKILDCGTGPASFNAELSAQGKSVVSVDPIYQFSGAQIQARFNACRDNVIAQVAATPENWVWTFHRDPEDLKQHRIAAMERFVADFESRGDGLRQAPKNRYRRAELPQLPFADNVFDLALCSHLLFLYSDLLSLDFHVRSILELCRLAPEVRIFPLRTLASLASPYVEPVREALLQHGIHSEIREVGYELQKGAIKC